MTTKKISKYSSRIAESFRTLRTNIEFVTFQQPVRTLVFTSSNRSEGKSTMVSNYGITLAMQGQKALIVDCDLRHPCQQDFFYLSNNFGLTEVLLGRNEAKDVIQQTKVKNLHVLTSGLMPPNPADLLNSQQMNQLIDDMKKIYDVIIFDTCPLGVASDPSIMAAKADGTILVVRSNQSNREAAKRAVKILELAQAKILGVVMNDVDQEFEDYYYYYNV